MPVYVTEHAIAGLTADHMRSVRAALTETSRRLSLAGKPTRLLQCNYLAQHELICRFDAIAEADVRQAIILAQLPLPVSFRQEASSSGDGNSR